MILKNAGNKINYDKSIRHCSQIFLNMKYTHCTLKFGIIRAEFLCLLFKNPFNFFDPVKKC
jgi:hypothetical protein